MKKKLILLLTLVLVFVTASAGSTFAAGGYKYRVTVYAGEQGHFGNSSDPKVWTKEYNFGESCQVDLNSLGFVQDNAKYYVRGFRIAGHDNDETSGVQNLNFDVEADVSYEIAYGIKGALVPYTVNYRAEDGTALLPSDTYYGMPGDKPVVSYKYVEGYIPQAYTQGRTLIKDGNNEFTFTYTPLPSGEQTTTTVIRRPAAPGTAANPAGTAAANGNANAAGNNGTVIGDNPTPTTDTPGGDTPGGNTPQQYEDNDVPKAEGISRRNMFLAIGGGVLVVALAAAAIAAFLRNREDDDDEDDEDDEDEMPLRHLRESHQPGQQE